MIHSKGDDFDALARDACVIAKQYPELKFGITFNGIELEIGGPGRSDAENLRWDYDEEVDWRSKRAPITAAAFTTEMYGLRTENGVSMFKQFGLDREELGQLYDEGTTKIPMDIKRHFNGEHLRVGVAAQWFLNNPEKDPFADKNAQWELASIIGFFKKPECQYSLDSILPNKNSVEEVLGEIRAGGLPSFIEKVRAFHSPKRVAGS